MDMSSLLNIKYPCCVKKKISKTVKHEDAIVFEVEYV